ncbi:MAG: ribosome recycling factor [Rhizobiales bacterium]|nr:ribosome recycling factor [Hyphomicrobiales bacterium]
MSSDAFDIKSIGKRMDGAVGSLKQELSGLRTGRASANLLDPVTVEVYGARMPINQVATVNVPEPRMITVQVWDRGQVGAVERAIRDAQLGLNPVVDGTTLRLPIPELNEERRRDLTKIAHKYSETARVAVRNVRRDGMDNLKKLEKDGDISQDEHRSLSAKVQELTDKHIKAIDEMLAAKEVEIMQV